MHGETSAYIGGIIGNEGYSSFVSNTYSTGNVYGWNTVGGIAGQVGGAFIQYSYFAGTVTVTGDNSGGIVGYFENAAVHHNFTVGTVTSSAGNVGGVIGHTGQGSDVFDTWWDIQRSGQTDGVGLDETGTATGGVNSDGSQADYFKTTNTNAPLDSWDFTTTWATSTDAYPTLRNIIMPLPPVNTLLDDGNGTCTVGHCTFRDALATAPEGTAVTFQEGLTGTIQLTQAATLEVPNNVSISGPGANLLTVDFGALSDAYLFLGGEGTTTVSGLTFTNSVASVLYANSFDTANFVITDTAFTNNTVWQPVNVHLGSLTIASSTFNGNSSVHNYGGAVYDSADQNLTINDSIFTNNTYDAGEYFADGYGGGAVAYRGEGTVTVASSTFNGNTSNEAALMITSATATNITHSSFIDNVSTYWVGAVEVDNGDTVIDSSVFSGNVTQEAGYGTVYLGGNSATVSNSTFIGNTVTDNSENTGGGAIYNSTSLALYNDTFTQNTVNGTAVEGGGAIYNRSNISIDSSTFFNDVAGDAAVGAELFSYDQPETGILIANTIIAGTSTALCGPIGILSNGYNIDQGSSCGFTQTGDLSSTTPLFASSMPSSYGGPVPTLALSPSSPAIDAGAMLMGTPGTDARGISRPQDGNNDTDAVNDIGAFEYVYGEDLGTMGTSSVSYDSGDGSVEDPYQISTCEQLQGIGVDDAHLSAHYQLVQDVHCEATRSEGTPTLYNGGAGFDPIGDVDHPFTGSLSGENPGNEPYAIYNMYINRPEESNVGIFAAISSSTIEHLYVHNGEVHGLDNVGLIAGQSASSTLDEVETGFTQTIDGEEDIGGLIGLANTTNITDSNYDGALSAVANGGGLVGEFYGDPGADHSLYGITASRSSAQIHAYDGSNFGGLVGYLQDGYVHDSYFDNGGPGTVDGASDGGTSLGGLIGSTQNADIANSYANAYVSGSQGVGGLIGSMAGGEIYNSHSTGTVQSGAEDHYLESPFGIGGLIGFMNSGASTTNSYSTSAVSVYAAQNGMMFSGFVGGLIGVECFMDGVCVLQNSYATGDVNVYIQTPDDTSTQLYAVGGLVGFAVGSGGEYTMENYASGNVTVNVTPNSNATEQLVEGVGGAFGFTENGVFLMNYSSGDVTVSSPESDGVGGHVGESGGSALVFSFSSGDVHVDNQGVSAGGVGGFVGSLYNGNEAYQDYSSGEVSVTNSTGTTSGVGGFVGYTTGAIEQSFSASTVHSDAPTMNVGGFAGYYDLGDSFGSLQNDYYLRDPNTQASVCVGSDGDAQTSISGGIPNCEAVDSTDPGASYFFNPLNSPMSDNWDFSFGGQWVSHVDSFPTLVGLGNPYTGDVYDAGDGSEENPYQINSCSQLNGVNSHMDASFILERSLTCGSFVPIGLLNETAFSGTFNGNGNSITITITNPHSDDYLGVFSQIQEAYIHDLTIHGSITSTLEDVGSLAGWSGGSRIEHVYSDVDITGHDYVGGIIGYSFGNDVNDLSFGGTIDATGNDVGGVIGYLRGGYIFNLEGIAVVTGLSNVGNLIGYDNATDIHGGHAAGMVHGTSRVGGAIGYADLDGNTLSQIKSTADTYGEMDVGGVVGELSGGSLVDSFAKGVIRGYNNVGGLAGRIWYGTLLRTYATGDVIANGYDYSEHNYSIGGLLGWAQGGGNIIHHSFSTGSVGVLLGYDGAPVVGSTGPDTDYLGALIGSLDYGSFVTNVYVDATASGQGSCVGEGAANECTAVNTVDEPNETYFQNTESAAPLDTWNFESVWETTETYPELLYPLTVDLVSPTVTVSAPHNGDHVLVWSPEVDWGSSTSCYYTYNEGEPDHQVDCSQHGHDIPAPADGTATLLVEGFNISGLSSGTIDREFTYFSDPFTYTSGTGESEDPFVVDSCSALAAINQHPSASYVLNTDLSCGETTPIYSSNGFNGTLDGAGHTITYSQTESIMSDNRGLFDYVNGGTIENLSLAGTIDAGTSVYAGALAGEVYQDATVSNVHSSMSITTNESYSGGLFGYTYGTVSISGSFVSGTTTGISEIGGLIGYTDGAVTISDSYVSGAVNGDSDIGGLIGYADSNTATIERSYASGLVNASGDRVGGLIGNGFNAVVNITDSFAVGAITVPEATFRGSLVGKFNSETFTNDWYAPATTGIATCGMFEDSGEWEYSDTDGACMPAPAAQFIGSTTNDPLAVWDFNTVWSVSSTTYPTLRAFRVEEEETPPIKPPTLPSGGSGRRSGSGGGKVVSFAGTQATAPSTPHLSLRDLSFKKTGEDVRALQQLLIGAHTGTAATALSKVGASGYFGTYTRAALIEYQKAHGITPALGYFGPRTRASLKAQGLNGLWW